MISVLSPLRSQRQIYCTFLGLQPAPSQFFFPLVFLNILDKHPPFFHSSTFFGESDSTLWPQLQPPTILLNVTLIRKSYAVLSGRSANHDEAKSFYI